MVTLGGTILSSEVLSIVILLCNILNYRWSDGTYVDYTYWDQNQPDDYAGQEACVEMEPLTTGKDSDVIKLVAPDLSSVNVYFMHIAHPYF